MVHNDRPIDRTTDESEQLRTSLPIVAGGYDTPSLHSLTPSECSPTTDRLHSVCAECGAPYERSGSAAQCLDCRPTGRQLSRTAGRIRSREQPSHRRGYGWHWRKLSERARRLQPFCSDCGSPDDLTTDHSPRAWARHDAGKVIRLDDIDVVCRRCNSERGPARGPGAIERERRPLPTMGE